MKLVILLISLTMFAACDSRVEKTQQEIKAGNPEGQQSRKKVEAAVKQGEEQRRKAIDQ